MIIISRLPICTLQCDDILNILEIHAIHFNLCGFHRI